MLYFLLGAAVWSWGTIGFLFFMITQIGEKKPNLILAAMCGPLAWALVIYYYTLYSGEKWG